MTGFKKEIIHYSNFYIAKLVKDLNAGYLVFIHGGPGFNVGSLEYLIEYEDIFQSLNFNLIMYEQRNCGRSVFGEEQVTHTNNVLDLNDIQNHLLTHEKIKISGFIGHSYGSKLLADYHRRFDNKLPCVFVSTADTLVTPRLNNLMLDLVYLKKINPLRYQEILLEMNALDLPALWKLTEKLEPLFLENTERPYFYWANLKWREKVLAIQNKINLPPNKEVLLSVRKELYASAENCRVDIHTINVPHLWINGFHDYIMNGAEGMLNPLICSFYQSSHYPHIEENELFCERINAFFKNN